ncbi:MAG: VCBS repeat-containing protein [Myxococcota bacterium]
MRIERAVLLAAVGATGCLDYNFGKEPRNGGDFEVTVPEFCDELPLPAEEVGVAEPCAPELGPNGFAPVVEWTYGPNKAVRATVAVGDLDGDGKPEIVANVTGLLPNSNGDLVALRGDGTELWNRPDALGFGTSPALADLDGDGTPEIIAVREYARSLFAPGDYTGVAFDAQGNEIWESEHFQGVDFDYATGPAVADMDHDGSPEVVLGRVILRADGTTRGVGAYGRGSYGVATVGQITISEGSFPAVADLDLDGTEEVVTGNAVYGPDGETLWYDPAQNDAMVGIANLDDDPEGEVVASSYDTVRAIDTNGRVMWGPIALDGANIVSPPAIGDLDGDGRPEIVVAGGNQILALHADGTVLWSADATDMSGASGASIFDFEGDGLPEVLYIDEVEMVGLDGRTGARRFWTDQHASDTMMDYPVIADVDSDGRAEIIVGNVVSPAALAVYGDPADRWAGTRTVWNQHAYSILNIEDDLGVPSPAVQNFTVWNTWHAALPDLGESGTGHATDLAAEILKVCSGGCVDGAGTVWGRLVNRSDREAPAGVDLALYAVVGNTRVLLDVQQTPTPVPAGWTSEPIAFAAYAGPATERNDAIELVADDDGTGRGRLAECDEDNVARLDEGAICP